METDANSLKQRARRLYEVGRLRGALGWSIPALILAALVALIVRQISIPLAIGVALYAASVGLLWWGRAPGRGVLPGLVYGLVPLGAAVIANFYGHACVGADCLRVCTLSDRHGDRHRRGVLARSASLPSPDKLDPISALEVGAKKFPHRFRGCRAQGSLPVLLGKLQISRPPMQVTQYGVPEVGPDQPCGWREALQYGEPCLRTLPLGNRHRPVQRVQRWRGDPLEHRIEVGDLLPSGLAERARKAMLGSDSRFPH